MIEKDTCGIYHIYFYVNLFNPLDSSGIIHKKNLNKETIDELLLLNEILLIDRQDNESRTDEFAHQNNISRNQIVNKVCSIQQSFFIEKLLTRDTLLAKIEFSRC